MLSLLYNLIFMPIEMLVEITYSFVNGLLGNVGLSIIAVSFVIQTIVLPLYKRADAMQDEERQRQKDMEHWVRHIKRTFSGDERYMMLSTYYREQNYKSWYAIKSSASILLQIPFFTAAYRYLSNLSELAGESFLFIRDLSRPDMSLAIRGYQVNILPILMTLVNIVSGIVYSKNLRLREKAQVYGLAAVFLVLLYNSPSGLVLYWTMNNVYSLLKNIVMKVIQGKWHVFERKSVIPQNVGDTTADGTESYGLYLLCAVFLTVFTGGVVLLNVVNSSASEFVNYEHGPIYLVISNIMIFAGIFIVWGSVFFALMPISVRKIFVRIAIILSVISFTDAMFFNTKLGRLTPLFFYEDGFGFRLTFASKAINLIVILVIAAAIVYLLNKRAKYIKNLMRIMTLSAALMGIILFTGVVSQVQEYNRNKEMTSARYDEKILHLSAEKENVIVIMIDRAINGFIPYIFEEKPEIAKMYDGFTYYPQTLSFGNSTNFCTPGLFGGYEYTPEALNKRSDESLKDKHNEALLVMPRIFSENGFEVTVCDPPYAGSYDMVNDLSIYDQYENVSAYNATGQYMKDFEKLYAPAYQARQESVAFYYCILKTLPVFMQKYLYNNGGYWSKKEIPIHRSFLEAYSTLCNLSNMTDFTDKSGFLLIQNKTTHEDAAFSVPDYVITNGNDNHVNECIEYYDTIFADFERKIKLDNKFQVDHYQSNLVTIRALGEWFDFLRQNDCWDNTRIIIVADHGKEVGCFDDMIFSDGLDIMGYNPVLLVKDFNSEEYSVSEDFMTIADVPSLAVNGVIDDAINPFSGVRVTMEEKNHRQKVTTSHHFSTKTNNGNTFNTDDGKWYEVKPGNILDESNWVEVGE